MRQISLYVLRLWEVTSPTCSHEKEKDAFKQSMHIRAGSTGNCKKYSHKDESTGVCCNDCTLSWQNQVLVYSFLWQAWRSIEINKYSRPSLKDADKDSYIHRQNWKHSDVSIIVLIADAEGRMLEGLLWN